jgi:hypothetical protein
MGRTKQLLEEDWERVWLTDYMYKMEQHRLEQEEEFRAARIEVIDNRTKNLKPHESTTESEDTLLPF